MAVPWLRFITNINKCIEGIQLLAVEKPGITQYYIGKVFFFADKAHFLDWGRTISGDRYVAMEHGPVPSTILNVLKSTSDEPDEIADRLFKKVRLRHEANKIKVFSRMDNPIYCHLSKTDRDYLILSLREYGNRSFEYIKNKSHEDTAYEKAWENPGLNNEMDLRLWLSPEQLDEVLAESRLLRRA